MNLLFDSVVKFTKCSVRAICRVGAIGSKMLRSASGKCYLPGGVCYLRDLLGVSCRICYQVSAGFATCGILQDPLSGFAAGFCRICYLQDSPASAVFCRMLQDLLLAGFCYLQDSAGSAICRILQGPVSAGFAICSLQDRLGFWYQDSAGFVAGFCYLQDSAGFAICRIRQDLLSADSAESSIYRMLQDLLLAGFCYLQDSAGSAICRIL